MSVITESTQTGVTDKSRTGIDAAPSRTRPATSGQEMNHNIRAISKQSKAAVDLGVAISRLPIQSASIFEEEAQT